MNILQIYEALQDCSSPKNNDFLGQSQLPGKWQEEASLVDGRMLQNSKSQKSHKNILAVPIYREFPFIQESKNIMH